MKTIVYDIQRFSIHDGPGIRTVIFFKGCNLVCPWCQNPESISNKPEISFYPDNCIDSHECSVVCSPKAITDKKNGMIDRELCNICEECSLACPSNALKLIGREYTVEMVMVEILCDIDYFRRSGGGVTFSGGEPTLHCDFLLELLVKCKELSIHTNIETNGYFSWDKFQKLLPFLDLVYFDIKIVNREKHQQHLGKNNDLILENIKNLLDNDVSVEFRLPLIPEYTTTNENLSDILLLLKKHKIQTIHLLPYHSMGEGKAEKIASPLPRLSFKPYTNDEVETFKIFFEKEEINTVLYR